MLEQDFSSLPLSPALIHVVSELGFTKMTPIQAASIPHLLEGKDLVGQSKTGSGKTAAFALPILQKIRLQEKKIQALVICPTRELSTQVAREFRKFGRRHSGLQVLILSGGQLVRPQIKALKLGVHIVVGTPGRILDHLRRGSLDLSSVSFLVLDEADRMLDMGFKEDMTAILNATPPDRQTLFFSATYPATIDAMSRLYQKNPARITIDEEKSDITQIFYESHYEEKFSVLLWVLQQKKPESALVFCNLKITVMELTKFLEESRVSVGCIHGDLDQSQRDKIMAKFRNHSTRILIATDVAARGLDVIDLDMVCNFDLPPNPDVYVHRIGRTGRAGKKGLAVSLASPREGMKIRNIEEYTGVKAQWENRGTFDPKAKMVLQDSKMETLFIGGGRKDKMRPGDILGALTGTAGGLNASEIGKIEIHDHFSYVALSKSIASVAMQRLSSGRIKGRKFRIERVK